MRPENAVLHKALGEAKTLAEWGRDPRCPVSAGAIALRMKAGMTFLEALLTPFKHQSERAPARLHDGLGESKTLREWSKDPRCHVPYRLLAARVSHGMDLEEAMKPVADEKRWPALGESKTISEWASDPRCPVDRVTLHNRLRSGMPPEEAITRPVVRKGKYKKAKEPADSDKPSRRSKGKAKISWAGFDKRMMPAHGKTMSIRAWLADPLCEVRTCATLVRRLDFGLSPEEALKSLPKLPTAPLHPGFGERKTLDDWSRDERCPISRATLYERVGQGMDVETAFKTPRRDRQDWVKKYPGHGEFKTLLDWSRDPHCQVTLKRLREKVRGGMPLELALKKGPLLPHQARAIPLPAFGETKCIEDWARDGRARASAEAIRQRIKKGEKPELAITRATRRPLIPAFGDRKTIRDWARDPRCPVKEHTVRQRLKRGIPAEEAITKPPQGQKIATTWASQTAYKWVSDPSCRVCLQTIRNRIARGMSPEEAITTPAPDYIADPWDDRVFPGFGESKTFRDWLADPRCLSPRDVVRKRLAKGEPLEAAIGPTRGAQRRPPLSIEGETKSIQAWARDPRCEVGPDKLRQRIKDGWPPELAIKAAHRRSPVLYPGFGERKTYMDWIRDPRREVSKAELLRRLKSGMPVEQALRLHRRVVNLLDGFGEQKSASEWAKDPRAAVGAQAILARLNRGYDVESAIMAPPENQKIRRFWDLARRRLDDPADLPDVPFQALPLDRETGPEAEEAPFPEDTASIPDVERDGFSMPVSADCALLSREPIPQGAESFKAYGETKTIREWSQDPRCLLTEEELRFCIGLGRSPYQIFFLNLLALNPHVR